MRRLLTFACFAGTLAAQDAPFSSRSGDPRFEIGLLAASGLGGMSHDLNGHPGFGLRIGAHLPIASRFELRPAFEWTGYRVSGYNLAARAFASYVGADYEETRTVFRTYRLGMDGLVYLRGSHEGPFLSLGLGVQRSQVYLEDRAVDSNGEQVRILDTSARRTGLWIGAGLGYQWATTNLELRLSRAPYGYASDRTATSPTSAEAPFGTRQGWALHLFAGVRF